MPHYTIIIITWLCCLAITSLSQDKHEAYELDVINYQVTIEPEIQKGYIKGTVTMTVQIAPNTKSITLNSGDLQIDNVTGKNVVAFKENNHKLTIELSDGKERENEITINYHGNPQRGLLFNSDLDQAHTVYFTSQWMVCNDSPSDKASLNLDILVPKGKECIASGELIGTQEKEGKTLYQWRQKYESPTYTYGFVIDNFNKMEEKDGDLLFKYYSDNHDPNELAQIFKETPGMVKFFEEKSGIQYYQSTYSQILIGQQYQEMSGFSVLKNTYGKLVLNDSTETNLISHELAHQWWGNRITCKSWNHFWLNEAFATYMSAAYNEYRFGKEKYDSDIASYYNVYVDIKKRGNDKSLVFKDWSNPSQDDRNLVYFKGAYVLHCLRQEIGDEAFWEGIKHYSKKHFGQLVTSVDFQNVMEKTAERNLEDFFKEWVYGKRGNK